MTLETRPDVNVPVWAETGDIVQPTNPEISIGWPPTTKPPSRQRFNWILNWCAKGLRYLLQIGIPQFAAGENYAQYAKVLYTDGLVYRALIAAPTAAPGVVAGEWEVWGYGNSTIQPRVDQYASVAVGGGSNVTITAAQAESGIIVLTGVLTANIQVILPNQARRRVIKNATTGAFTLTLACPSAGATLTVNQNQSVVAYVDGSNNVYAAGSSDLANALLIANNLSDVANPATALSNIGGVASSSFTGTNQSLATNGYQKLPGGLIVQWGMSGSIPSVSAATITLPVAFPTANLGVYISASSAGGAAQSHDFTGSPTLTNFTIQNSASVAATYNWFAIGH